MDTRVIGQRIVAFIIDVILAWIVVFAAGALLLEELDAPPPGLGFDACNVTTYDDYPVCFFVNDTYLVGDTGDLRLLVLIGLGAWVLLRVVPQAVNGRTLGKKLLGIKVVNENGDAPGIGRSLGREILWIVDALPFLYLIGLITAAASKQNQRVGDMVAGTRVVRATSGDQPPPPVAAAPPAYQAAPPPTPTNQPVWDPQRNAYVHTAPDGTRQVYDDATGQWRAE